MAFPFFVGSPSKLKEGEWAGGAFFSAGDYC